MRYGKRIGGAAMLGAALLVGASLFASPADAGYIVTLTQQGSNVVANGSGTIDLTGLISDGSGASIAGLVPDGATINTGPAAFTADSFYSGYTGPASFGSGSVTSASSGSGDIVGIGAFGNALVVPSGYVSGSALSDTSTYADATFASLGVTPGSYVWTWNSGPADDSFTLKIGATPVPEPSGLLLLALPLGLVMLLTLRQQRRASRVN